AAGPMGIVAALSSTGIVVPIAVGLALGDTLTFMQSGGLVLVAIGIIAATIPDPSAFAKLQARTLILALVSALGFGTMLTLYAAGAQTSVTSTLFFQRVTYVVIMATFVILLRPQMRLGARNLPIAAGAGLGAVSASGLYALATQLGAVSISAVLAPMSPVVTLVLSRLLPRHRLSGLQAVGTGGATSRAVFLASY